MMASSALQLRIGGYSQRHRRVSRYVKNASLTRTSGQMTRSFVFSGWQLMPCVIYWR